VNYKAYLPDIKSGSLRADFNKLKRELFGHVAKKKTKSEPKKKSDQQQVSKYLDKNPEASFGTLKSLFPDIKPSSLGAYMSMWKKEQELKKTEDKPLVKKELEKPAEKLQPDKVAKLIKKTGSDSTELIDSLKKTIGAQGLFITSAARFYLISVTNLCVRKN